jgi:hypothetical protein
MKKALWVIAVYLGGVPVVAALYVHTAITSWFWRTVYGKESRS